MKDLEENGFTNFDADKHRFSPKVAVFSLVTALILEIAMQNPSMTRKYIDTPLEKFRDEIMTFFGEKKTDTTIQSVAVKNRPAHYKL